MIRVCHIITKLELGGAQQNTLYTVQHLSRRRFDPILVTGREGILAEEAGELGDAVHFLPSLDREISPVRDAAALVSLCRLLRRLRPDVVHTHSSKAGILGRWAARLAGVPHIVHSVHGFGFHPDQPRLVRGVLVAAERATGRLATHAVVAVSQANIETGVRLGLFDRSRTCLIRSGVRLADFHPRDGAARAAPGRPIVVGMVACLKPQKAPLDFVQVARLVVERLGRPPGAGVRFVLAGDGKLRPQVERMIASCGLSDRIDLAGWRRDVPDLMRGFDLLLHTSRWEGLPRVFPEAMATGLPIVATRVDGAPEAIEEGVNGYLLEAGDVEGMARRVLELCADEPLRRRMGSAALARTSAWDIDEMVRRQERLYEALVAGPVAQAVALATQAGR